MNKLRVLAAPLLTLFFVLPLFWLLAMALRDVGSPPPASVVWLPRNAQWGNFVAVAQVVPKFGRYLINSTLIVSSAVPLTLLTSSIAGFALSQLPHSKQRWLITPSIALLIVPAASIWIFRFELLQTIGLIDTLWALIIPAIGASSPLYVLLYFWTFERLPSGIVEAARLDGANAWQTWSQVAFPLAHPTTAAVTVLAFVLYWSDFVSPVLYIFQTDLYTLPIWVQLLNQLDPSNWPLLMAGSLIMLAPVLLVFLLLQRTFLTPKSLAALVESE